MPDVEDAELKARHRKMWALGDYPSVVETFALPLGPVLVGACGITAAMRVLDVAAGSGNASIPAAKTGADVTASDLTPELFDAGRLRAKSEGVELKWVEADAERLPFEDGYFDVVMSSIGVMFAPHHQGAADELVRVCRAGGTIGMLNWTPEGMSGALFRTMAPFAPPPPPGAQPASLWGSEEHVRGLFRDRVDFRTLERQMLTITAFEHPHDYAEHFKQKFGPTIVAQTNAVRLLGTPSIAVNGAPTPGPPGAQGLGVAGAACPYGNTTHPPAAGKSAIREAADQLGALRWSLAEVRRALGEECVVNGDPVCFCLPAQTDIRCACRRHVNTAPKIIR